MVEALILAVAAQVAVLFLQGNEVVGHGNEVGEQLRVSGALVGSGCGVHPFAGMLAPPAAFTLCDDFGGEERDGLALGTVDVVEQAAVVAGIDGVAEQAADNDGKDEMQHISKSVKSTGK